MKTLLRLLLLTAILPLWGAEPDLFTPFLGVWQGEGAYRGSPATATLTFTRELKDQFAIQRYQLEVKPPTAPPFSFEGRAFYRQGKGAWVDTNGSIFTITYTAGQNRFESEWAFQAASMASPSTT